MADEKVIAASLTVDPDAAVKGMLKAKQAVEEYKKELKNAKEGTIEQVAAFKKLKAAEEDLTKANKQLTEGSKESAGHFGKLKEGISSLPGATGAAGQGVTNLSAQFKKLLANPVVLVIALIVAGLAALAKAFASTRKGADLIGQGMAFVGGAIDKVVQIVGDFITSITSVGDLLSKIGGFLAHPIDSFKKLGKEVGEAAIQTAKLKKEQQLLERDQINNIAKNKELIQQEEALKNIRDNEFNTAEERIAANEKAAALEKQRLATIEGLQLREVQRLQALIKLKGGEAKATNDQLRELREAELVLADVREESIGRENEFITNRFGLQKEAEEKAKALRDKATEEEKARLQNLMEFERNILKLRQENQLALITDNYLKEAQQLRFQIADEKKANEQLYKDKKISLEQLNQLNDEIEVKKQNSLNEIRKKNQESEKAKEKEFQKELSDITTKTRLAGIKDARVLEQEQAKIANDEKLTQARERYKDDAAKLAQIEAAIDEQYRLEKAEREKKFKEEDDNKQLEQRIATQEQIANNQAATFEAQRMALDAEQALLTEAFNNKILKEEEYGTRVQALTEKRKKILELETAHRKAQAEEAAGVLEKLSELIGKKTLAGKLLGIAAATINTFQGASEALKQPSTLPSPFDVIAKIVNVTAVIAAGLKTVKAIASVQVPGGGGGGQSVSAPSLTTPAAPIAPTQASTSLDQGTINNIGNAAAGGVNSVRAYVVEQDSAAAAARAARLAGAAVLGG
jgi:hypothetical protein